MMKKFTFLCCVWAMLFPFVGSFAQAENKAIQIESRATSSANTEYEVEISEAMMGTRSNSNEALTSTSFTFAGWFNMTRHTYLNTSNDGAVLLGHGAQAHCNYNGSVVLATNRSGQLRLISGAGNTVATVISDATMELNTWTYLTLVYDNDGYKVRVYKDGQKIHEGNNNKQLALFGDNPAIFFAGAVGYQGAIDELHYFNKALSDAEVLQAYKGDVNSIDGLTGLWDFNDEPTTTGTFNNKAEGVSANIPAVYYSLYSTNYYGGAGGLESCTRINPASVNLVEGRPESEPAEERTVTIKHIGTSKPSTAYTKIYTYTIKADGQLCAYTETDDKASATLNATVPEGTELTVEVTVEPSYASYYKLLGLTANGQDILATKTYIVGADNVEIDINVGSPVKVNLSVPENVKYTLTYTDGETVDINDAKISAHVCLTITDLPEGQVIDQVTTGGTIQGAVTVVVDPTRENYYEFTLRYMTTKVTVTLKAKPCKAEYSVEGSGTLSASVEGEAYASGSTVVYGSQIVFTAQPAEGYELDDLTVDGESVKEQMDENSYTLDVTGDHRVVATFALIDGLETAAADDLRLVYAAGQLRIEGMPADAQAAVYSLAGTLVKVSAGNVVDLAAQPAGCYLVKVSGDRVNKTMKFIKK